MSQPSSPSGRGKWWSWIRISEIIGGLALVIAALGFWDNHTERKLADQARMVAEQRAGAAPAFVLIGGSDPDGQRIALRPVHEDQVIQSQVFVFPPAVRAGSVETTGGARIEGGWFEQGLRKTAARHGTGAGDLRLPVGISTTYLAGGDLRVDQSIYDIGYRLQPRFLRPDRVVLEGLSVVRRGVTGDLQRATDEVYRARGGDPKS